MAEAPSAQDWAAARIPSERRQGAGSAPGVGAAES